MTIESRCSVLYRPPHFRRLYTLHLHGVSHAECEAEIDRYRDKGAAGTALIVKACDVPLYPIAETAYSRFCLESRGW